jgi:hypothetical protein
MYLENCPLNDVPIYLEYEIITHARQPETSDIGMDRQACQNTIVMSTRISIFLLSTLFFSPLHAVELSITPATSTTGTFDLRWQGAADAGYELEERRPNQPARIIYRGRDTARVVTGLPNGQYAYRIRDIQQKVADGWSETHTVLVQHHSLTRALTFFTIGLLVFLATLAVIIRGEGSR